MRFDYDTSYRDADKLLRNPEARLSYSALVAALIAAPLVLSSFYTDELTYLFIMCVASLGLMVVTGMTGMVSLGHAAFLAIGAYAETWLLSHGVSLILSLPLSGVIAGALGLVIGLPAIRVSGLYLAMVTLAFASIIEHVAGSWASVTGGFTGMQVPDPDLFGFSLGSSVRLYYLALVVLVLVLLALINLMRAQTGRAFAGIRDSEAAANSLGIYVAGYKILAFTLSAAITGLAGALMAHQVQFITPEAFNILQSMELLLMVVIGGLGSLRGAIFGAILVGLLPNFISAVKPFLPGNMSGQFGLDIFIYGLVLAIFVLFEPTGLNGRWLKMKKLGSDFPLYRRDTFKRGKSYMRSERYR
jgi:branched-chain amino acid transport system permease protein